jgi:hypothetical protein
MNLESPGSSNLAGNPIASRLVDRFPRTNILLLGGGIKSSSQWRISVSILVSLTNFSESFLQDRVFLEACFVLQRH